MAQVVKNTSCSCRAPRTNDQNPHGGWWPFVATVSGHLVPSFDLKSHQTCTWYTHVHAGKICIHVK